MFSPVGTTGAPIFSIKGQRSRSSDVSDTCRKERMSRVNVYIRLADLALTAGCFVCSSAQSLQSIGGRSAVGVSN